MLSLSANTPSQLASSSLPGDFLPPIGPQGLGLSLRDSLCQLRQQNLTESQFEALLYRVEAIAASHGGTLRVGMYDGSFDPPHYGHVETARAAMGIAHLDLLVINCHPKPSAAKPNLSAHEVRTRMVSSYFEGDITTIVSPLSRSEIEQILSSHGVCGIIGSDAFNRFLRDGIAPDFNTQEIFVAERRGEPLRAAPEELEGRPVWYCGAGNLAFNDSCSTQIRRDIAAESSGSADYMLNASTKRLAHEYSVYTRVVTPAGSIRDSKDLGSTSYSLSQSETLLASIQPPDSYHGCSIVRRPGLQNGLLSESYIFEVKSPSQEIVAFMKMLPTHRCPETNLRDEESGLKLINDLALSWARAPHAELREHPTSLWVARAPGETIGSILTGYERGLLGEQEVYEALRMVGRALSELHTCGARSYTERAAKFFEAYVEHYEGVISTADRRELLSPQVAQAIADFRESALALRTSGLRCSLIHGDANCGNILWDADGQQLYLIDLQRLGTQVRTESVGFSTHEFQTFVSCLHLYPNIGFRGMRGGLEAALLAYREGYGAVDSVEELFFRSVSVIRTNIKGHMRAHPIREK